MMHWKGNIDSFICPVCNLEVSNPRNYPGCKCPRCGFQDPKDAVEYHNAIHLLSRAGVVPVDKAEKYVITVGGRSGGKTIQQYQLQLEAFIDLIAKLSGALEKTLDEKDALEADFKLYRERNIMRTCGVYACDLCGYVGDFQNHLPQNIHCPKGCDGMSHFKWRGVQKK